MFLGLDLGTSSIKAVLMDEEQRLCASQSADLGVNRPQSGWSEQDPADWIAATETVMSALSRSHPKEMGAVRGIGLSGHMHGATLIDGADAVLRPCMLWNDTRSHEEAAQLDAAPDFRDITGNIVFPGFTAPKVDWVRRNEPEIFDRVAKVLLPKDYLRLWLTGAHLSEMSDAAGTAWFDTGARDWSDALLAACHLSRDHMPALVEGSAVSGTLRPALAEAWGLPAGVVVAGGAGDNAASAIGVGAISEGDAFVSLGTSGVLFVAGAAYRPKPESAVHSFCHALPQTWHQMGVILSATDALNWFAGVLGVPADQLTAELPALSAPAPVTFLPYLSGERTPHNDAQIRGSFTGIAHGMDRSDMVQGILDGVAFALADNLQALASTGTKVDRLLAVGGGSRARIWLEIMATALDVPIELPVGGDFGAAFGAARLGQLAASGAAPEAICTRPEIADQVRPRPDLKGAYEDAYGRFKATYPALRGL